MKTLILGLIIFVAAISGYVIGYSKGVSENISGVVEIKGENIKWTSGTTTINI